MNMKTISSGVLKHGPSILVATGILGYATSIYLAVKAAPKAEVILNDLDDPTLADTITSVLPVYIPAGASFALSTALVISAHTVQDRRNTALLALLTFSENAFEQYRSGVKSEVGPRAVKKVDEAVRENRLSQAPIDSVGTGDVIVLDRYTGRYFRVESVEALRTVFVSLNESIYVDDYVALNQYFQAVGLENIPVGDDIGWHVEHGVIDYTYEPGMTIDDRPCLILDYDLSYRWVKKDSGI